MKKLKICTLLILLLLPLSCVDGRVKTTIHDQSLILEEYVKRSDAGQTTAEQDKAMLKAQSRNWQAIDHYFNKEKGPKPVQ